LCKIISARGTGKGANSLLLFGAGNGNLQMAKNNNVCLFRRFLLTSFVSSPFQVFGSLLLSFGMEKNRGEHLRDELGEVKVRRKKKTKILKVTTEKTKERYLRFKINQVIKRKPQFDEVQEVYFPNTEQNHCFIVLCSE
jgi:hypothetical protein